MQCKIYLTTAFTFLPLCLFCFCLFFSFLLLEYDCYHRKSQYGIKLIMKCSQAHSQDFQKGDYIDVCMVCMHVYACTSMQN